MPVLFTNAKVLLADRELAGESILVEGDRIVAVLGPHEPKPTEGVEVIDCGGDFLAAGFVELHTHGGDGADFMDGTPEAFMAVCKAHARHGTTSVTPTSCVAPPEHIGKFLDLCDHFQKHHTGGASVVGAHLYGPYFSPNAVGCHPTLGLTPPTPVDFLPYLDRRGVISSATVAAELPGAELFVRACVERGIVPNVGHSHATFADMEAAVGWGVKHVDHLFCAMSDRAKLRLAQPYPMRGGVMEATLFFDELSTEVIADGTHLAPELLRFALKCKGVERLALVTDCSRAMGMPDGLYAFGPAELGRTVLKRGDSGLTPEGTGLGSGVMGMDHCLRLFVEATGLPLYQAVRCASLTPATILGIAGDCGSIAAGKRADLVRLDGSLKACGVWVGGTKVA